MVGFTLGTDPRRKALPQMLDGRGDPAWYPVSVEGQRV